MTREEAIKMAKADLKCMKRDTSGQDEMCNSHKCDECSLNYERGNIGEQKEWLRLAIKALEQKSKTGHWIKEKSIFGWDGHSYQCSECGRSIHLDTEMEDLEDYPYCHCGAKMQEVEE